MAGVGNGRSILVTGAGGYIGSVLCEELLAAGYEVCAVDTFSLGDPTLAHLCANRRFSIVKEDVRNKQSMARLYSSFDAIIPLAALVGAPLCDRDPVRATEVNQRAVEDMVGLLSREQAVLMPITNSGYGVGEANAYCTEESPLNPLSHYGRTKVAAEQAVLAHDNAISFRLATVFGMAPRMRLDLLVNDFVLRAVSERVLVLFEAHFRRNYIHIRDVANAFLHGLENLENMRGESYNVGLSDANLTKLELAQKIKSHVPDLVIIEAEIGEDPDKRDYLVSNEKIEATGFVPKHSLDSGIRELMAGYLMMSVKRFSNI